MSANTIVFATYSGSVMDMMVSDAPFCLAPELKRYTMPDGSLESDECFFERKLEKIKKISDERTLIVIDNFDVDSDEYIEKLTDGKYHLMITTRCDYSRLFPTVRVDAISSIESLREIFMLNYGGYDVSEEDPALDELIETVNRHTYTVELLAQHMESSGQTAAAIAAILTRHAKTTVRRWSLLSLCSAPSRSRYQI